MLFQRIAQHAAERPMSVALSAPGREPLLFRDVPAVLEGLRQWTADKGCAQGDVVGLVMPNGPEMALTLLGCSMHCTVAPIDPAFGAAEVKAVLQRMGARAVVVAARARSAMDAAAQLGIPALAAPLPEQLTGLAMGVISSLHCVGMCGPLALAVPVPGVAAQAKLLATLFYNTGRVVTYATLGAAFRLAGFSLSLFGFQQWLSILAGAAIIVYLLYPQLSFYKTRHQRFQGMMARLRNTLAIG